MNGHHSARPGFTLIEVIITIGITVVVAGVAYSMWQQGMDTWKMSDIRGKSQDDLRRALESLTAVIREARPADNGAFALEEVGQNALTFYSNVDADGGVEQVRYYLNGTDLMRRVINPSGSPAQYLIAGATTSKVIGDVRSLAFTYYDSSYSGSGVALTQPVSSNTVRMVGIALTVDDNPAKAPEAVSLSTMISVRNLKDNL